MLIYDDLLLSNIFHIEIFNMKTFKEHKSILLKAIEESGKFGYALYSDEIVSLLNKHIEESLLPKRPTEGLVEFVTHMHIHGVPLNERNTMVETVLERYYNSLFPKK